MAIITAPFFNSASAINSDEQIPTNHITSCDVLDINAVPGQENQYQIIFTIAEPDKAPYTRTLRYATSVLRDAAYADIVAGLAETRV